MSRPFDRITRMLHRLTRPSAAIFDDMQLCIDKGWYLNTYRDVAAKGLEPVAHFFNQGAWEGRLPNRFFDPVWYVQRYPEAAGRLPIVHYATTGRSQDADPGPFFSGATYFTLYPDIKSSGFKALDHYIVHGQHEGREISDAVVPDALQPLFRLDTANVAQQIAAQTLIDSDNETALRIALAFTKRGIPFV